MMLRMRPLHLALLLSSSACWLTPAEVDEAKRRIQNAPGTVVVPPPTDTGLPLQCLDDQLLAATPLAGSTIGASDHFVSTCGKEGAPDRALLYTAAVDGCHSVRALGSGGSDPVVALFDSCVSDTSLACNDDFTAGNSGALLFEPLVAGQGVIVVVETAGDPGPYTVDVAPLASIDMGSALVTDGDTRAPAEDVFDQLCVPPGHVASGGMYVRWVAPAAGSYRARLQGSGTNDVILSLHRGCTPQVAETCVDVLALGGAEVLDFTVANSEAILFRVASYDGSVGAWTLTLAAI